MAANDKSLVNVYFSEENNDQLNGGKLYGTNYVSSIIKFTWSKLNYYLWVQCISSIIVILIDLVILWMFVNEII